ncbi:MAG: carbohydrate kinase family protein [Syntrophomonas sp.]
MNTIDMIGCDQMGICGLGTIRLDFHIYMPKILKGMYSEAKIDNLDIKIGGSVFNTTVLLKNLNMNLVFYTIMGNDELSLMSRNALKNYNINYKCTSNIDCKSPITFIQLDSDGEKTMLSYDENSYACEIIDILQNDCNKYEAFYTSCYEVNKYNQKKITTILANFVSRNKKTFIDLSPLTYTLPKDIWNDILPFIKIITGTENEFNMLIEILGHNDLIDFKKNYSIEKVFIKRGAKGCSVLDMNGQQKHFDITPVQSRNMTGCGDAFNAGVILGELKGFPTEKTVSIASKLAFQVAKSGFEPVAVVEAVLADING